MIQIEIYKYNADVDDFIPVMMDFENEQDAYSAQLASCYSRRIKRYPPIEDFADAQVKINSGIEELAAEGQTQLAKYYSDCLSVKTSLPKPTPPV